MGRQSKCPLELSNGQAEADKPENIQAAPVFADGEEPSAKSIRCQYTAKQKQRVVLSLGTTEFVPLKGSSAFCERISSGG